MASNDSETTMEKFEEFLAFYLSEQMFPNSFEIAKKLAKFHYIDSGNGVVSNGAYLMDKAIEVDQA